MVFGHYTVKTIRDAGVCAFMASAALTGAVSKEMAICAAVAAVGAALAVFERLPLVLTEITTGAGALKTVVARRNF